MARPPISVYIRTRNEARMIDAVVRAGLKAGDEVLVIDCGSDDGTPELAAEAGARVIETHWRGNGAQKRFAEEACRHDWVFDLDADELISPALAEELRQLFESGPPPVTVYRTPMAFAPPYGPPWIGFGGQVRHKLYDRRAHRAPDHAVWDQFTLERDTHAGRLREPILHHAWRDTGHLLTKLNNNSTTRAAHLKPKPTVQLLIRIFFALPFYFLKRYLLDGLFRAGVQGFTFSLTAAFGRWLRDVKMYERQRMQTPPDGEPSVNRSSGDE